MTHPIDERIAERRGELSPQERRAADTLLDNLDDLATYRASELATLAGVSKATMSRLFRSLGFADFDEVRDHLRGLRYAGEPRRVEGVLTPREHARSEAEAVDRALDQPLLAEVVALVAGAERVVVVGWRNSYPVALHLRQQLIQIRPDVLLAPLPGQTIGEDLADLGETDVVVLVGFRRRPAGFMAYLTEASATGAAVILIADPTARELGAQATHWLECPVATGLAFDSYAAAMSLISVLSDQVLTAVGRPGGQRASRISSIYGRLAEVE